MDNDIKYEPIAVPAIQPNGEREPVYSVTFTQSGLLIDISSGGWGLLIDRFAWPGIVAAVAELDRQAEVQAKAINRANYDPMD